MVSSVVESDIDLDSRRIGKVRVLRIDGDDSKYPRLRLELGWTLNEVRADAYVSESALLDYELREFLGELRLDEHRGSIGLIHWMEARRGIRCTANAFERHTRATCELDVMRLHRIEEHRRGHELVLWCELWPTVIHEGKFHDVEIRPFRLTVPRDDWIRALDVMRYRTSEILEVECADVRSEAVRVAVEFVRKARVRIDSGDYAGAILQCRNAIESIYPDGREENLRPFLIDRTDKYRGEEYGKMASTLKQLGAITVHSYGKSSHFSRGEALFVVRTAESFLELFGRLSGDGPHVSGVDTNP